MTCAFCGAKFPTGKRMAFDPARARLWEICSKCGQWNLAALDADERRATIEKLEQTFAATTSRTVAAGVGVAKLQDGKSVVRVGNGNWSQFAAWRYGKRLLRRRTAWIAWLIAIVLFSRQESFLTGPAWTVFFAVATVCLVTWGWYYRPICRIPLSDGTRAKMTERHERHTRLCVHGSTWQLLVRHNRGESSLTGSDALRVLAVLLARRNGNGASKEDVAMAIEMIERAGGPEMVFTTWLRPGLRSVTDGSNKLSKLPKPLALALEMAAHEETERRALQGELAVLKLDVNAAAERARIVEEFA